MLSKTQLLEQLELQDRMNSVVNPDWINAGYDWQRAIMVEAVETLEHYGWKWWKKSEPDIHQVRMELVDIWHFILSAALVRTNGRQEEAADWLTLVCGTSTSNFHPLSDPETVRLCLDGMAHLAAIKVVPVTRLRDLLAATGMSWDDLHRMYIGKNVLNLFRQANGYREGTYVKVWNGKEDNEVLTEILAATPTVSAKYLSLALDAAYKGVLHPTSAD